MISTITADQIANKIAAGVSKSDAAKSFGVCTKTFDTYVKQLGLHYPKAKRRYSKRVEADVDALVSFIIQNGGSIPAAARFLDLKTTVTTLRKKVKERGIDLKPYRLAHRKYGAWTVLSDPSNMSDGVNVKCRCGSCGVIANVSLHNLHNKRSSSCKKCAALTKQAVEVKSKDGTEVFPSIAAFTRALGIHKQYQSARIALTKGQDYLVDNRAFIAT